eukprot:COSAG01_NODE_11332_length_1955_cov_1.752155_1_plen_183_part_10
MIEAPWLGMISGRQTVGPPQRRIDTHFWQGIRIAAVGVAPAEPAIRVAECPHTGLRHFSALVPAQAIEDALRQGPGAAAASAGDVSGTPPRTGRAEVLNVAVVWDVSASRRGAGPDPDTQLLLLLDQIIASTAAAAALEAGAGGQSSGADSPPRLQLSVVALSTELVTIGDVVTGAAYECKLV